jgi:cytochrome c-type biogenesis protein CcmH/NrfG
MGRDLGIALTRSNSVDLRLPAQNAEARRLLESSVQKWPNDVDAWCALGQVHLQQGRHAEALAAYEHALAEAPEHELALTGAASTVSSSTNAAVELEARYWTNAIRVDPWRSSYRLQLAQAHTKRKEWELARDEYQTALRLNPASLDARKGLVRCLTHVGKADEARVQLGIWLALQPLGPPPNEP